MRVVEIIADLPVADIEAAKDFYAGYLGLADEQFNLGWVARFTSPDTGAQLQVVTRDETAPQDAVISVRWTTSTRLTPMPGPGGTRSSTH
ncbi:hypothetical protein ACQBAU_12150 [Propionibacteriaceae bacterium Y2011]